MFDNENIPQDYADLAQVQAAEQEALLAKPNVVGVALGTKYINGQDTGEKAVTVLVEMKVPENMLSNDERVPRTLGKVAIDVQEVGVLQAGQLAGSTAGPVTAGGNGSRHAVAPDDAALATREDVGVLSLKRRFRPAFGGVSVGHIAITAGTLGTCCYDASPFPGIPPRYYILSNNHVLANSNAASIGDPILQPGRFDGGVFLSDLIARLSRFVPIKFIQAAQPPPQNFVDAAIAEGEFHDLDRRIYWVGDLKGINNVPTVGMRVQKTGRTTSWTTGTILNINATVNVNYSGGKVAQFFQQILTTKMACGGDSGSVVADLHENAVGLLFAGSPWVTVINRIALVQSLLNIRVAE